MDPQPAPNPESREYLSADGMLNPQAVIEAVQRIYEPMNFAGSIRYEDTTDDLVSLIQSKFASLGLGVPNGTAEGIEPDFVTHRFIIRLSLADFDFPFSVELPDSLEFQIGIHQNRISKEFDEVTFNGSSAGQGLVFESLPELLKWFYGYLVGVVHALGLLDCRREGS